MAEFLKTLPQNIDAEKAVLGSILLDDQAINAALEEVGTNDFYDQNHRKIFSAMLELDSENKPIDVVTLYEKLKSSQAANLTFSFEGTNCRARYLNDQLGPSSGFSGGG